MNLHSYKVELSLSQGWLKSPHATLIHCFSAVLAAHVSVVADSQEVLGWWDELPSCLLRKYWVLLQWLMPFLKDMGSLGHVCCHEAYSAVGDAPQWGQSVEGADCNPHDWQNFVCCDVCEVNVHGIALKACGGSLFLLVDSPKLLVVGVQQSFLFLLEYQP